LGIERIQRPKAEIRRIACRMKRMVGRGGMAVAAQFGLMKPKKKFETKGRIKFETKWATKRERKRGRCWG
jgi:hypothetical protein